MYRIVQLVYNRKTKKHEAFVTRSAHLVTNAVHHYNVEDSAQGYAFALAQLICGRFGPDDENQRAILANALLDLMGSDSSCKATPDGLCFL